MTRRLTAALLALVLLASLPPATPSAAAPPPGFSAEVVPGLGGLNQPTAFAFLPDGSMLITSKPGRLLLYQGGTLRATPVFDRAAATCSNSERGLLGVEVDPAFSTNRFVYVYYTFNKHNTCATNSDVDPVNRVSRLTLSAELVAAEEQVLVDNIPSPNGNHNAGDLRFGKDGYLYIATGDGGTGGALARQRNNLAGKILRITRDGAIPPDNPYLGSGTARCNQGPVAAPDRCQEIFAFGLRNPFRFAFDPNAVTTSFLINDVGQGNVEEISAGQAGGDYGWNCFEGTRVNNTGGLCAGVIFDSTVPPTFEYRREGLFAGCASITGGAFVPAGAWPAAYDGAYLFADYVCRKLFVLVPGPDGLVPGPGGLTSQLFDGDAGAAVHLAFGPDGAGQALYYADIGGGDIVRVRYTGADNRSPTARLQAAPDFGDPPLEVALDASASSDPDPGDSIVAYLWDFDDGSTRETAGPTTSFTFNQLGQYTVSVRARDSRGAVSAPATARIDVGNDPPAPQILAPAAGSRFGTGEPFTLRGSATDPEDGTLAGERLSWEVRRHHDTHFHPYLSATGAEAELVAPAPEDLAAVGTSWLEIRLTATDSLGRTTTVTRELRPAITTLRIVTDPPGLKVAVNDGVTTTELVTPASVPSWRGWTLTLVTPAGQTAGGTAVKPCGWSNGGEPTQSFTTPSYDRFLVAVFVPESEACPELLVADPVHLPLVRR
jgi:glucose/arabinose dehydrogenase/PKD repeat protein